MDRNRHMATRTPGPPAPNESPAADSSQADEALRLSRAADRVIERFPAGGARGSWLADDFAKARRAEGIPVKVVMDLASDSFLVVKAGV